MYLTDLMSFTNNGPKIDFPYVTDPKLLKLKDMKATLKIKILAMAFFSFASMELKAQPALSIYTDFGSSNVSRGTYQKAAALTCFNKGENTIEAGFQTEIRNQNNSGFSGFSMKASRKMMVKHLPVEIQGFYMWLNPAGMLVETNWGAQLMMRQKHMEMSAGTNFRTFSFKSLSEEGGNQSHKLHEVYNMMYSFTYYLKPSGEKWNIGLTLTNADHFMINQETNPLLNLCGSYRINSHAGLYIESWYKTAGLTNLVANNFGLFVRTGIVWNLN
jgi:hypothetical protein